MLLVLVVLVFSTAPGRLCARRLPARLVRLVLARLVSAGEGRGVELRVGEGLEGQDALAPARPVRGDIDAASSPRWRGG